MQRMRVERAEKEHHQPSCSRREGIDGGCRGDNVLEQHTQSKQEAGRHDHRTSSLFRSHTSLSTHLFLLSYPTPPPNTPIHRSSLLFISSSLCSLSLSPSLSFSACSACLL